MGKIAIVIPAYEPDSRLLDLLDELVSEDMGPVFVVNDGSGEQYEDIFTGAKEKVEKTGGRVLIHEVNRGKGRALKTAFSYILEKNEEISGVVTADSDGQHTCECIKKVMEAASENSDCLILGVREFNLDNIPWKSRFGNVLTEKVFKYITGVHVSDTQTGLRGIPRDYMRELLDLKGERFEFEMRMLIDAAGKMQIIEVPIKTIYDSKENHQTHFDPFRDSVRIYRILAERFLKFIVSSLSSSVIDVVLFGLFCSLLKARHPELYVSISTVLARVISATYNYLINYVYVFKSKEKIPQSALKYFSLAVVQMGCSALFVTLLTRLFPIGLEVPFKIVVDTVLFFISYKIQQSLIFNTVK